MCMIVILFVWPFVLSKCIIPGSPTADTALVQNTVYLYTVLLYCPQRDAPHVLIPQTPATLSLCVHGTSNVGRALNVIRLDLHAFL